MPTIVPGPPGERDQVQPPRSAIATPADDDQQARQAETHGHSTGVALEPVGAARPGRRSTAVP